MKDVAPGGWYGPARRAGLPGRIAVPALAAVTAVAPVRAAKDASPEGDTGLLGVVIVVVIVLFVVGLGLHVWRDARMSPGWRAFIERRKAQGRSTTWKEWDDDEKEKDR